MWSPAEIFQNAGAERWASMRSRPGFDANLMFRTQVLASLTGFLVQTSTILVSRLNP